MMSPQPAASPSRRPLLKKVLGFFQPQAGDVPCLGLTFGRRELWAVCAREGEGGVEAEWSEKFSLEGNLFSGEPSAQALLSLNSALGAVAKRVKGNFLEVQVALPDPALSFEVFELEKIPGSGAPRREFLTWRFNQSRRPSDPPLAFTSQLLGEEEDKTLLWAAAVEQRWLDLLRQAFHSAGLQAAVIDMALGYRFNFFHQSFLEKKTGGALVAFEPDYWSLAFWDKEIRPRFARSKWWEKEKFRPQGPSLENVVLEIERTIRSYVYSGKSRNVETLFVSAPEDWLEPVLKALNLRTEGRCVGLPGADQGGKSPEVTLEGMTPSSWAAAVRR